MKLESGESAPKRIQRKRTKGWKMPPNTVYVGRPTPWGNPFKVTHLTFAGGEEWCVENGSTFYRFKTKQEAVTGSINLFRAMANQSSNSTESWRRKAAFALNSKNLACFCPLDQPCHADVLLEIANVKS